MTYDGMGDCWERFRKPMCVACLVFYGSLLTPTWTTSRIDQQGVMSAIEQLLTGLLLHVTFSIRPAWTTSFVDHALTASMPGYS